MLLKSFTIYRYLESPKTAKNLEKQKNKARSLGDAWETKKLKNKTLRRMFGFDSKDCFFTKASVS